MEKNKNCNGRIQPMSAVRMLVLFCCVVLAHTSVLAQMYGTTDAGLQDNQLLPWINTTELKSQMMVDGCTFNFFGNKDTKEAYMTALDDNPDYNPSEGTRALHVPQQVFFDGDSEQAYQVAYLSASVLRSTKMNNYGLTYTTCLEIDTIFVPASVKQIVTADLKILTAFGVLNKHTLKCWSIAEDNPSFKSIDGAVYSKDGDILMLVPFVCGDSFTVPNGVKTVDWCAFTMTTCKEVKIPEGVETVYSTAFKESNIQEVVIPGSVTYFGRRWERCNVMTNPSRFNIVGNKEVGTTVNDDFYRVLSSDGSRVVYGEGVKVIEAPCCGYSGVPGNRTVVLPMSLERIVGSCTYMSGLNIEIPDNHPKYQLRDSCLLTVDDTLLCLQSRSEGHYFVPEGVKVVADNCGGLIKNGHCVIVPASVTRMGFFAGGTTSKASDVWHGPLKIEFLGLPPEPSDLFVEQAISTYRYASWSSEYNIMIRVPAEYEEAYRSHEFWGRCHYINDIHFRGIQGIDDVTSVPSEPQKAYDLQGRAATDAQRHGIVVRDGKKYVK